MVGSPRNVGKGPGADFSQHPAEVRFGPIADSCTAAKREFVGAREHTIHSGKPAFRRPSINSFAFDGPPPAMNADIVKAGSNSSRRATASRASASRPRWAKADARQQ